MRSLRKVAVLVVAALPVFVQAAELSTAQRLELLERRVARVSDLTLQLDEMRRENRQLRGEVENLGYEIEQLKRKQRDIYLDIDQRLSGLQPAAGAVPPPAQAAPAGGTARPEAQVESRAPQTSASASREQIQAEYKAAYDLLSPQQKRYTESAAAFTSFVDRYPDDELTPNAKYWLGEAYYVSQQNAKALQAFEKVVADHPGSTKAPGALFKIGRLQQVAGKAGAARAAFERVLKDYPNAPAAGLARQQLKKLGG